MQAWQLSAYSVFVLILGILLARSGVLSFGPYRWMSRDNFDEVMERMDQVNAQNCYSMSESQLRLPPSTLAQIPQYNKIPVNEWYANRSSLLHLHNLAFNRAFFYSYILQRLNTSQVDFPLLPGFQYYYFSASADISSAPGVINGSAMLYDTNCSYPNWYTNMDFNTTVPLFGPKATRLDNYNDEMNWVREPTNNTIEIIDLGAGPDSNYTASWYKNNPYITDKEMKIGFIPDFRAATGEKHQYDTTVYYADIHGNEVRPPEEKSFFGPPSPGVKEEFQPVRFTRPYFDCGRSNKWIVSAVAPVVDYMARYSKEERLRGPRMVGIVTMDIDFLRIDINPCPPSEGNDPHYFAGTARCKPTTMCEPIPHMGYQRGSYQCSCKPGYRLPFSQNGPFQGSAIEQATEQEYTEGFDCLRVGWRMVQPQETGIKENLERRRRSILDGPPKAKKSHIDRAKELSKSVMLKARNTWSSVTSFFRSADKDNQQHVTARQPPAEKTESINRIISRQAPLRANQGGGKMTPRHPPPANTSAAFSLYPKEKQRLVARHKRSLFYLGRLTGFDPDQFKKVREVLDKMKLVSKANCKDQKPQDLQFPGEVGYGVDQQFQMQGRTALRLAHFLSAYYQNHIQDEIYGNLKAGLRLNKQQLYGEVIANTMSDFEVFSAGILFDNEKYVDENGTRWKMFAPVAYRSEGSTQAYLAKDLAIKEYKGAYMEKPWFKILKERYASNTYNLDRYIDKPLVRTDQNGTQIKKYDNYPLYYRAPRYEDGFWSQPYFDCGGFVEDWVITYSAPFFGSVNEKSEHLQFLGVTTITVKLKRLDINQCPADFFTPNFFKNTARCDYRTTYCTPIPRRRFIWGSYKCECRQGFEYPFNDLAWFYDGQTMEEEYSKKMKGEGNKFDILRCREAHASTVFVNTLLIAFGVVLTGFTYLQ